MSAERADPGTAAEAAAQAEPSGLDRVLSVLPSGDTLPELPWEARHRAVLAVLLLHVPVLFALGVYGGRDTLFTKAVFDSYSVTQTVIEVGVIALFGAIAAWPRLSRRIRGSAASLGLITSSAVLVQFSGGFIEAHFHFFVVLALLALYEDWIPFLLGIGYVLIHHGTVGTVAPGTVYNHPTAITFPWRWAAVHAFFITGLCAALTTTWRMSEDTRAERRRVLDAASDGILGFDPAGTVSFANPAAVQLLGQEAGSLVGSPIDEALDWVEPVPEQTPRAALDGTEHRATDARLRTADGSTIPVEWVSRPVVERGRLRGGVLTLKDISEQKRVQLELEAHARRLKRNNEEWEEFGHAVSHDLKEPLRTVASYCQLVSRRYEELLDEAGHEYLEHAITGTERMADLLDGLRTFSQVGVQPVAFDDVDLEAVVQDTLRALDIQIAETDAEVSVGSLPTVKGSESQLGQLFQNLVSNAIKFHSDEPLHVEIRSRDKGEQWVIEVEDNGRGMDQDRAEEAFRMFKRMDPEDDEGGQGIGLAICKAVVNRHGGRIDVDAELDGGCCFTIELPKEPPKGLIEGEAPADTVLGPAG